MNAKKNYQLGVNNFKKNNYELAKYYFTMANMDSNYRIKTLKYLFKIEKIKGRFDLARNLLDETYDFSSGRTKDFLYGGIEMAEFNFKSAYSYFKKSLEDPIFAEDARLELAILSANMGNTKTAIDEINELKNSENNFIQTKAIFYEIYYTVLLQDYEKALELCEMIDKNNLSKKYQQYYNNIYDRILWLLNKYEDSIQYGTLIKKIDDKWLLQHIKQHEKYGSFKIFSHFEKDVNLEHLLNNARESIQNMNGIYNGYSEKYFIHYDYPIGFVGTEPTNDLCVITALGTNEIITMYPGIVSNQYDREGLAYSKTLREQRQKEKIIR